MKKENKYLEEHKHYIAYLKKQDKERALKGMLEILRMKIINRTAFKVIAKEVGLDYKLPPVEKKPKMMFSIKKPWRSN